MVEKFHDVSIIHVRIFRLHMARVDLYTGLVSVMYRLPVDTVLLLSNTDNSW